MKRYAIWNKQDDIITPSGKIYTAAQWIDKYPVAGIDSVTIVCSAGEINGGVFGVLSQMVRSHEINGVDFSGCTTNEEKLELIEACEDAMNKPNTDPTPEERIAAALEYQVIASMPDVDETV